MCYIYIFIYWLIGQRKQECKSCCLQCLHYDACKMTNCELIMPNFNKSFNCFFEYGNIILDDCKT